MHVIERIFNSNNMAILFFNRNLQKSIFDLLNLNWFSDSPFHFLSNFGPPQCAGSVRAIETRVGFLMKI